MLFECERFGEGLALLQLVAMHGGVDEGDEAVSWVRNLSGSNDADRAALADSVYVEIRRSRG